MSPGEEVIVRLSLEMGEGVVRAGVLGFAHRWLLMPSKGQCARDVKSQDPVFIFAW